MVDLKNLHYRVTEMMEAGQAAAKTLFYISDAEQLKMLKVYKEVSKVVGSSDMEITLLKVSISSLVEKGTTDEKDDNCVDEVPEKEMKTLCKAPTPQQSKRPHVNNNISK